jgi:hypothetical protein
MAAYTAQIIIGRGHSYDKEGIIPDETLWLSDTGDRPAWILNKKSWIPSIENMLEDGLLMAAVHYLKDPELVEMVNMYFTNVNKANLYDISNEQRQMLYRKNRQLVWGKLIITVFHNSSILSQVSILENYLMDVEVCLPIYSRNHSGWDGSLEVKGDFN